MNGGCCVNEKEGGWCATNGTNGRKQRSASGFDGGRGCWLAAGAKSKGEVKQVNVYIPY